MPTLSIATDDIKAIPPIKNANPETHCAYSSFNCLLDLSLTDIFPDFNKVAYLLGKCSTSGRSKSILNVLFFSS